MSAAGGSRKKSNSKRGEERQRWTAAEITGAAISVALLLVVVAGVVYQWVYATGEPPVLQAVQAGPVRQAGGSFYVPIEVSNDGDEAVTGVLVNAEIEVDGQATESADLQFDWLSGGGSDEGEFVFSRDPSKGELVIRVGGYLNP